MIVFLLLFCLGIYLFTLFPTIAPYRDAGEMATVVPTLSIAHPTGYPLYTLLGKLFITILPFGNIAYRLNIFSALFGSLSAVLFYLIITELLKKKNTNVFLLSFVLPFSYLQWYLSIVSEMYTLNTFFALLILYLVLNKRLRNRFALVAFIFGIGLGNRLDLIFLLPGIIYLIISKREKIYLPVLFFLMGLTIYAFLLLRSQQQPLINWNEPANLSSLLSTISRKTHGGTLDLISLGYRSGENFVSGILFYFNTAAKDILYLGMIFFVLGSYWLYKYKNEIFYFCFFSFFLSSFWFIYKANMPPNPHALAIIEAHFLLPNLFLFLAVCYGLARLNFKSLLLLIFIVLIFLNNYRFLNKRMNFFAYDYSKNVLNSVEKNSIVVLKEDVQLFSNWYLKHILKKKTDVRVIAQGLSGSKWYKKRFKDIYLTRLNEVSKWSDFIKKNDRSIYITGDVNYKSVNGVYTIPFGLCTKLTTISESPKAKLLLDKIYIYRGNYNYHSYREFFTPDLIEEYAKARYILGRYLLNSGDLKNARDEFHMALAYKKEFPLAKYLLSYSYFLNNNFKFAEKSYESTVNAYLSLLEKARKYKSSMDVISSIKKELSEVYLHLGVIKEKMNDLRNSLLCYNKAIRYNPIMPEAYYNRAVIFWRLGKWKNVISDLQKVLQLKPDHKDAKKYLKLAKEKLKISHHKK